MDRYTTKRWLLRPLTAWRRRRAGRLGPFNKAVFEACDYRPSMVKFFAAAREDPDILVDVDLPAAGVVLDVGAYEGSWSKRILARADRCGQHDIRVYAFEPAPDAIDLFEKSMADEPRVELHHFGLGGRDRTERMAVGGLGSSVFVDPEAKRMFGEAEIELRDIDAVLSSLSIDRIDLIKINIEGGEYELIDRLRETGWLARTGTVIVQFHEFAPDAYRARRRNRRELAQTHTCTWNYTWVYERWDRIR